MSPAKPHGFCEVRVRRGIKCAKKAKRVADLGMALCWYHEENERKLRALGIDSRKDGP